MRISGPTKFLPGTRHETEEGAICDDCGAPATITIQGDTDSFGAEYMEFCEDCHERWEEESKEKTDTSGHCEWCDQMSNSRTLARDPTEGEYGPLYYICIGCLASAKEDLY